MSESINVGGVEFTPEQIQALKAQAQLMGESTVGEIFDNNNGAETAPRIGAVNKVTRPQLRTAEGTNIPSQRVTRPSAALAQRLGDQEKARIAAEAEARKEAAALAEATSSDSLQKRIAYLERTLKRVEKQLKEQKNG